MNKKYTIIISVLLILVLAGYYWWSYKKPAPSTIEQAATNIQQTVESINQNVAAGIFVATTTNPIPDVNPYKNTNPFSDIKTNPFQ